MTTEEAVWIVEVFDKVRDLALRNKTIDKWYEAERILRGWDKTQPRSCSCEYRTLARLVQSFRSQYDSEIMRLYNEAKLEK